MKDEKDKKNQPSLEDLIAQRPPRSYWQIVRKEFLKSKLAVLGLVLVIFMFTIAVFAPIIANNKPFVLSTRLVGDYQAAWNSLFVMNQNLGRKIDKIRQEKAKQDRMKKVEEIAKQYGKARKNAQSNETKKLTLEQVIRMLEKKTPLDKVKAEIVNRRTQFFDVGVSQENRVLDLFSNMDDGEAFLKYLKTFKTKWDKIDLDDVVAMLKKKTPHQKIWDEIRKRRVSPIFTEAHYDDLIDAGVDEGFINKLANFESEVLQYLKKGRKDQSFSLTEYVAKLDLDRVKTNFAERVRELNNSLVDEKREGLDQLDKEFQGLVASIKKGDFPDSEKFDKIQADLQKYRFPTEEERKKLSEEEKKVALQLKDIKQKITYPILYQLGASEIYFMALYILVIFAFIPFAVINRLNVDSFNKAIYKALFLILVPGIAAGFWVANVEGKEDTNDYRKIIANFGPGDYARIPPIFYGPLDINHVDNYLPPSWSTNPTVGFDLQTDGKDRGIVIYEKCKITKSEGAGDDEVSCPTLDEMRKKNPEKFAKYNTKVQKTLPREVRGKQIIVLSGAKEYKIRRRVPIQPGGILIVDTSGQLVTDAEPLGYHWTTTDYQKLPNYHFFGTDKLGRDNFTRMIWGARISLAVGFVAVGIYVFIGILLGSLAGFFGGWIDIFLSRLIEIVICFPTLILIITLIAVLPKEYIQIGNGMVAIMVVIGITGWTGIARLIRGEFLRLRNQDFVIAGRALGVSNFRLIFRHIVPNALAPVLVAATFGIASAILIESSLSFLGLGVQPPTPTWGDMLAKARQEPLSRWWLTLFPGFAIFLTVTSYNLVGEGVRDALDPRLKER